MRRLAITKFHTSNISYWRTCVETRPSRQLAHAQAVPPFGLDGGLGSVYVRSYKGATLVARCKLDTDSKVPFTRTPPSTSATLQSRLAQLEKYSSAYCNGNSLVDDEIFDRLKADCLKALEAQIQLTPDATDLAKELERLHSGVGAPIREGVKPAEHTAERGGRLLSLAAVHSAHDASEWLRKNVLVAVDDAERMTMVVEPKVDGLTMRATYQDGHLLQAATRGTGYVGEDVTPSAQHIAGLPLKVLHPVAPLFTVRGEVHITKKDFAAVNKARASAGESPFSNARNTAAGSLRLLDPGQVSDRKLSFIGYELLFDSEGVENANQVFPELRKSEGDDDRVWGPGQWSRLGVMEHMGFATVRSESFVCQGPEAALTAASDIVNRRDDFEYELDGSVIKVHSLELQARLGSVGSDPKWAVALKPPPLWKETKLLDIELSVGRSDIIVPIAVLEAVQIGGVTVQRASLHNTAHVSSKDLRIGDRVVVERRGDVIPQISEARTLLRTGQEMAWVPAKVCPCCQSPLQDRPVQGSGNRSKSPDTESNSGILVCSNSKCQGQLYRTLAHFANTCIDGLGKKTVEAMLDAGLVSAPEDFYTLTFDQIRSLPLTGDKKAAKLLAAIKDSEGKPESDFLTGFGIPNVGSQLAALIADQIQLMKDWPSTDWIEFSRTTRGMGTTIATSLSTWFADTANIRTTLKLSAILSGRIQKDGQSTTKTPLISDGQTGSEAQGGIDEDIVFGDVVLPPGCKLVVTGSLTGYTRSDVEKWVKLQGRTLQKSVTSKTAILIRGDSPGKSKLDQALALGVPVQEAHSHMMPLMARSKLI